MTGTATSGGDWRAMDRATLSTAYDNVNAVADAATRLARWSRLSAAMRTAHPRTLDLPYGPRPRNRIDIFESGAGKAPLLVFIHGGYWLRNAKEDFACMAAGPLAHGLDVALVGYTLAPEARLTTIVAEIRAALMVLRARDRERGRERRLVVSGWSAGGHLAAMAWPEADAVLAISGIFDLAPIQRIALNDTLRIDDDEVEALSPIRRLPETRRPIVIAFGAEELPELRRQSVDYHRALSAQGHAATLCPLATVDHFSVLEALIDPAGALTEAAVRLATDAG